MLLKCAARIISLLVQSVGCWGGLRALTLAIGVGTVERGRALASRKYMPHLGALEGPQWVGLRTKGGLQR